MQIMIQEVQGWFQIFCIPNKLLGDANTASLGTTLQ